MQAIDYSATANKFVRNLLEAHIPYGGPAQSLKAGPSEEEQQVLPEPDSMICEPSGKWAWISNHPFSDTRSLNTLYSDKARSNDIKLSTVNKRDILYYSVSWWQGKDHGEWAGFFSEIALFNSPKYLQPLQGDVVPRLITVLVDSTALSQVYELPHHSFWIEASHDMPIVLKERCIEALRKLHALGILHGHLRMRDMIIGGDGHVTIKRFYKSRCLKPDPQIGLKAASPQELKLEMRKLLFMLDYDDAQAKEQRWILQALQHGDAEGRIDSLIDHISFDEYSYWFQWRQVMPKRYIVPGQSADDVRMAVSNFITLVKNLEIQRARSMAAEPSTVTEPLPCGGPAGPSRKRALPESIDAPPRKRRRTPDSASMSPAATPDYSLPLHTPERPASPAVHPDTVEDHPFFRLKERPAFTDEERDSLLRHALIRERNAEDCRQLNLPYVDRYGRIRGRRGGCYALGGLLRDLDDAINPGSAEEYSELVKESYRSCGKLGSGVPTDDHEDPRWPQGPPILTQAALESRRSKGKGRSRYAPLGILGNSSPGPVDEEAWKAQDEVKLDSDDLQPWHPRPTISLRRGQTGLAGPDTCPGTEELETPQPCSPAILPAVQNRQFDQDSSRDKVKISKEISTHSADYRTRDVLSRLCASLPGANMILGMWHRWTE